MARTGRRLAAAILVAAVALPALRLALPGAAARAPTASPKEVATVAPVRRSAAAHAPVAAAPVKLVATKAATPPAAQPLVVRRILDTGGPLRYGTWFWDDAARPAGPLTITVDLKASVLSVFRGGDEIATTAVIYGADAKQTPLGTFPILQKDRHHFSSTYHHAPMPYTLRLTGDGVSIHASAVAADYATHGCIGVPRGFAERLFAIAHVGDRVIVTNRGLRA